jgi:hypothetical protein
MGAMTQGVPGYYVWEIPGKPVAIHVHLDVVDRLLVDVMRGFGAVRKRGAEIGGLLIGTIEPGDPTIVRIEDFESIECGYKRGPSYLFTEDATRPFEDACDRWQPDDSRPAYAVGYFRSNTREGFSLSPDDIELLDACFPSPYHVALLIKPYGTKVSMAGFFVREDGVFPQTTPLEFPFRRRELTGEEAPPHRPMTERRPRVRGSNALVPTPAIQEAADDRTGSPLRSQLGPAYAITSPSKSRLRSGWVWIPLSFIFLLLGVLLGFQAALSVGSKPSSAATPEFGLGLAIAKTDDNLSVKWDRQAVAVRTAQHGLLEIEDGKYTKSVELDTAQLQNGSIIYRNTSKSVRFRLIVYPKAKVSVTETAEWKQ